MRKNGRLIRTLLIISLTGALALSTSGQARRRAVGSPVSPAKPTFTANQIESYLSEDVIAYIRSEQQKQGFEPYPP